mmetsp:Transcript_3399/g.7439  ORF Transcript_3399/g.7439 Transcript_3399/m.7439 type:complete len:85 (-) Transcript_3399:329-583(-)
MPYVRYIIGRNTENDGRTTKVPHGAHGTTSTSTDPSLRTVLTAPLDSGCAEYKSIYGFAHEQRRVVFWPILCTSVEYTPRDQNL